MKTIFRHIALLTLFVTGYAFAQDVTTVRANNSDISDNLDLKAVASIFGDSSDLEDFERRLNDPDMQISNLDLNGDNRVDYLRVIEASEKNVHVIIVQAVLGADTFQDVATIEVERDRSNNVQVQVVGDVYMYGPNYIYEPVYVYRPFIFDIFWVSSYRPYYSPWYWGYYPTYYSYWAPCPVYRYRSHVHTYINPRHSYVYSNTRRSSRAANLYGSRRQNAYERQHPNTSFSSRNSNMSNRYALEQTRTKSRFNKGIEASKSSYTSSRGNNLKSNNINAIKRGEGNNSSRGNENATVKNQRSVRNADMPARNSMNAGRDNSATRIQNNQPARVERSAPAPTRNVERSGPSMQRSSAPSMPSRNNSISTPRQSSPAPSMRSAPSPSRQSAPATSPRGGGNGGGNSRRG